MFIKQLTLKGFKSFASSTVLNLEPGITCIVGPNGSGKSNVVDALAWVMGEQGAKTLRGGKMDDVIFAGSDGKSHALGRAEVSLTIDNSDGKLPIEYSEVAIKRIMFRGGGSEYEINGKKCRLLDIQELLSDTGLGAQMHVIVGQGRLDAILNATPLDRRGFIEEAAGVLKYRKRKEKAVRKLDNMHNSLMRLTDLAAEVRRQLGPLGRQADVAKRANQIQIDVRDAKSRIYADDYLKIINQQNVEKNSLLELNKNLETVNDDLNNIQKNILHLEERLSSKELQTISEQLYEMSSLIQRFNNIKTLSTERIKLLDEPALLIEGQDLKILKRNLDNAKEEKDNCAKKIDIFKKQYIDDQNNRIMLEEKAATLNQKCVIMRQNSNQRRETLSLLEAKIVSCTENLKENKAQLDVYKVSKKQFSTEIQNYKKEIDTINNELVKKRKNFESLENDYNQKNQKIADTEKEFKQTEGQLQELINSQVHNNATILALNDSIIQKVGKDNKLKTYKIKQLSIDEIKEDISKYQKHFGNNFIIASSKKTAYYISELSSQIKVISPDGEVLEYENRSDQHDITPIYEKIDNIKNDNKNITKQITSITRVKNNFETKIRDLKDELRSLNDILLIERQTINETERQISAFEHKIDSVMRELSRTDDYIESNIQKTDKIERTINEHKSRINEIKNEPETDSLALQKIVDELAKTEVSLSEARNKEQNSAANEASIKSTNAALEQRYLEMLNQYNAEIKAREDAKIAAEIRAKKAKIAQKASEYCDQILKYLEADYQMVKALKDQLMINQTSNNSDLTTLRLDLKTKQSIHDDLLQKIHQIELEQASFQGKIELVEQKTKEELGISCQTLIEEFHPDKPIITQNTQDPKNPIITHFNRGEQEKRLNKAQKDLSALGKVNPLALEEFEALQDRHKYLSSQLEDLEKSRKDLLLMIDSIEQKTITAFLSAFNDTAKEFKDNVFPALFPGGKGHMELSDPDNPLTTGIEIYATPAGKRINRLSLLSGGERSLVAVAMLVSIFKSRPSPFYVMDEVEAALDDVNLSRLLRIFKQLQINSQLLIVTHQKRTMEVADALYGITMRKDGITQVISQRSKQNAK